jgi:hypothetical protein
LPEDGRDSLVTKAVVAVEVAFPCHSIPFSPTKSLIRCLSDQPAFRLIGALRAATIVCERATTLLSVAYVQTANGGMQFVHPAAGLSPCNKLLPTTAFRQGRSGLGIEAQRAAITRFTEAEGFTLLGEFTEIETGKSVDALDRRQGGSTSILAEPLDRHAHATTADSRKLFMRLAESPTKSWRQQFRTTPSMQDLPNKGSGWRTLH